MGPVEDDVAPVISSMLSSAHDLDVPLTEADISLVEEFEARWLEYLQANPSLMPTGERGQRVEELRGQVLEAQLHRTEVQKEMEAQLQSFSESREALESHYHQSIKEAMAAQKKVHDNLQKELDNAAIADQLDSQIAPWSHFVDCVDKAAGPDTKEKTLKPSARAMALVDASGDPRDVQLRAYRIDHALLTTQVKMLQKQVERCERTTEGLETVGKFLTENNIWALLSKTSTMP